MAWGRSDRKTDDARSQTYAVLAAAHRTFGERRQVEALSHERVRVDGLDYTHDPRAEPPFILVPECDRCGGREVEQFPLETWTVDGVRIQGQARSTCRDCRFLASPMEPGRPTSSAG